MANNYLGQTDEYSEPSKLQQVMAVLRNIGQTGMRAGAAMQDPAFFEKEKQAQAGMALKERALDIDEKQANDAMELKKMMMALKGGGVGPLTPAQTMVDKRFAQDYADYNLKGGYAGVQRQLSQLNDVANALESGEITTGVLPGASVASSWIGSIANPKLMAARQAVENAVQQTLRQTLGAQFTEREGQMMLERAFDPKLPPQENAKKLRNTIKELSDMVEAKEATGQHYEQYGTTKGFKGTENRGIIKSSRNKPKTVVQNGYTYTLNEETGEYE